MRQVLSFDIQRPSVLVPPATSEPAMRFSVLVALIAYATLAIIQLASATAVFSTKDMVVKRDNADIIGIFNKLKTSLVSPLSGINSYVADGTANQDKIAPLVQAIIFALIDARFELNALNPASVRKRQSNDKIVILVAEITTDITSALIGLLDFPAKIPLLGGLLDGVDISLSAVLLDLQFLLAGVLRLVANLLVDTADMLRRLDLDLTRGTLGFNP